MRALVKGLGLRHESKTHTKGLEFRFWFGDTDQCINGGRWFKDWGLEYTDKWVRHRHQS